MMPLAFRDRRIVPFTATYGRLYGEGAIVQATSNHRWPRDSSLRDAQEMVAVNNFAECEARARREIDDVEGHGRHVLCFGPRGLWQVTV